MHPKEEPKSINSIPGTTPESIEKNITENSEKTKHQRPPEWVPKSTIKFVFFLFFKSPAPDGSRASLDGPQCPQKG